MTSGLYPATLRLAMTRPEPVSGRRTPARRKATLFCWGCDHESPIDGDWIRRTQDRHVECVCPVCETTLATRPRSESDETVDDQPAIRPIDTWRRTIRATMGIWYAGIDVGLANATAMTVGPFE